LLTIRREKGKFFCFQQVKWKINTYGPMKLFVYFAVVVFHKRETSEESQRAGNERRKVKPTGPRND
jgi:hypothetical protein